MRQSVIVYKAPHGEWKAYDTAYTPDQQRDALERCREAHGDTARMLDARRWPREYLNRLG